MTGQMWPIQGASKAKRLRWASSQNQISWAYMKMLREGNRSMRVYPVNPYVEVYQFYDNLYGLFNQSCDGGGDLWNWLIIGPTRAMLIDTAFGLGDTKGLVATITGGMPLIVANTHAGRSQCLGNCRFEQVCCHEYDHQAIQLAGKPNAWDYLFDSSGRNIWLEFDKKDLPAFRNYVLIPVKNGHTFNLGDDYEVELVWTGGCTAGHAMYMDKKSRYLFAGADACSDVIDGGAGPVPALPYGQYANLSTYRDNLVALLDRRDQFDYVFPSRFMVNLENNVLLHVLDTLNEIIAKPESYSYKADRVGDDGSPGHEMRYKYVKGLGTVGYVPGGVYPAKT